MCHGTRGVKIIANKGRVVFPLHSGIKHTLRCGVRGAVRGLHRLPMYITWNHNQVDISFICSGLIQYVSRPIEESFCYDFKFCSRENPDTLGFASVLVVGAYSACWPPSAVCIPPL